MIPDPHQRRPLQTFRQAARVAAIAIVSFGTVSAAFAADEVSEPALSALVAPRAPELQAAGIESIIARTGKHRLDIQVLTRYGAAYFGWPKNVTPALFELYVGRDGRATVFASDYSESTKARYAAALDAIVPEAIRQAGIARAAAQKPRH